MDKKTLYIVFGFISVFFALVAGFIAMNTNALCGLFVLPAVAFIAYNVIKAVK